MDLGLGGKTALITGASGEIGSQIALRLAEEQADTILAFLRNKERAEQLNDKITKMGRKSLVIKLDVRNFHEVQKSIASILTQYGKIDILINNAGINMDRTLVKMTEQEWNDVIEVDLKGVFNCTKAVLEPMIERNYGRIVNISSIVGIAGNFGQCNYAAAKAGMIGFTKSLAKEVARKGITVNAIAPGFIETQMVKAIPKDIKERILNRIPLGRFGKPEEIANLVCLLVSDLSGYITGQVFVIDGGYL